MKENALEFDEEEDDDVARFLLSMADSEKARVSLRSLKISRAWKNWILSLSLSEKMFRNPEDKVFGYWENLRESETEVILFI